MELLDGLTLRQKMDKEGKIHLPTCVHIMEQIADALAFTHQKNIMHRDLKPSNIMVIQHGEDHNYIKLMDFGLAKGKEHTKITVTGVLIGTISYMSPEQLTGREVSYPGDIFSLGVIFFEMLTGIPAFPGNNPSEIMKQVLDAVPVQPDKLRPELPPVISPLVMRMLEKNPEDRPTADAILKALQQINI